MKMEFEVKCRTGSESGETHFQWQLRGNHNTDKPEMRQEVNLNMLLPIDTVNAPALGKKYKMTLEEIKVPLVVKKGDS